MEYPIRSSDAALLEKASRVAKEFARDYMDKRLVGIVFLGAVARGYFDAEADIDIALFKEQAVEIELPCKFLKVEGLEVHVHLAGYEDERLAAWDMPKRWTFAHGQIHYDPTGRIAALLADKVPLQPEEKRWLLMSGLTLSEWYVNRLTDLMASRGSLVSAHHMLAQGIIYFYDLLFGLNDRLVPDMKWRQFEVEHLPRLPADFMEHLQEAMTLHAFTLEELERRKAAFMSMWRALQPQVEKEIGLTFDELLQIV